MNEFLEQFLIEARELVEQATSDILALEGAPADRESLDGAFRAFHTLKGGAGIVDFAAMGRAVHAAEDVLSSVRKGERAVTSALIGDCLACLDRIVKWLDWIQDAGELPEDADADADALVTRFSKSSEESNVVRLAPHNRDVASPIEPEASALEILRAQRALILEPGPGAEGRLASAARLTFNIFRHIGLDEETKPVGGLLAAEIPHLDASRLAHAIDRAIQTLSEAHPAGAAASASARADPLSRSFRIDAARVDSLVGLASELTAAKNAIGRIARQAETTQNVLAASIQKENQRLEGLIGALQRAVLQLRVLPLRGVFQRFARLVREMSDSQGKSVRLEIEGGDTEADKAIVEALFEPLLHVVRNAMDHGIETKPERSAAGKPGTAVIHLRARRDGENVVVEVIDDGRGIDVARTRSVAIERGVAAPDIVAAMSDEDVLKLIFVPGFSTAATVSNLSGRGVGMDAVRTSVERLGGRVLVESQWGAGSIVRFVLPFSVMITQVMTVTAGGQMFGVPVDAVVETTRVARSKIQPVGHGKAFVMRNRTIPLIQLGEALGLQALSMKDPATIVLVGSLDAQLGGLEVEGLGETMNVMMKPPEGLLTGVPAIAGTTLLGDGAVLLILDARELIR